MARLIDVEPLIDECDECINIEWNHKVAPVSWADAEEEFKQRLLDAPTIEAEPVMHGKWTQTYASWSQNYDTSKNIRYRCSECNGIAVWDTKYCPYCGARMDGE